MKKILAAAAAVLALAVAPALFGAPTVALADTSWGTPTVHADAAPTAPMEDALDTSW